MIILVITAILVVPVTSVLHSDDSDAVVYDSNYRGQLTENQQTIYDALSALDTTSVTLTNVYGWSQQQYAAKVTVPSTYVLKASSAAELTKMVMADMTRAYQATLLDNPMAWWAWSTDDAHEALFYTEARIANNQTFKLTTTEVSGFEFYVFVSSAYYEDGNLAGKITAVNDAVTKLIDDKKVSGDTDVDKVKSINAYLCSDSFVYNTEQTFCNSVYGAFVYEKDGKHQLLCTGFSQAFKLLCDKLGVKCANVVGLAAQSSENGGHMWNVVTVNCTIDDKSGSYNLGVDVTFDKTSGNATAYLLSGSMTVKDSVTFSQVHQAFAPLGSDKALWVDYDFTAPTLNSKGYTFATSEDIVAQLTHYAPWILVAIICVILAYVLWNIARRGE